MAKTPCEYDEGLVEHPLTFASGITVASPNGSAKCYTYGKVCYISLNNITFANTGFNQQLISGVPKPIAQVSFNRPGGSMPMYTEEIENNGAYISKGATTIKFNIGSNNNVGHWMNATYLTE